MTTTIVPRAPLHGLFVLKVIFTDRGEQTMLIGSTMPLLIGTAGVRPNSSVLAAEDGWTCGPDPDHQPATYSSPCKTVSKVNMMVWSLPPIHRLSPRNSVREQR